MRNFLTRLSRDRGGATAIEYGLILVLIVIAIFGSVQGLADENSGLWARILDRTTDALS